jgi:hypothetical protein
MAVLSFEEMIREWTASCQALCDITGEPVHVASVPGGYYSRRVAKAAARAGIDILFTSEPTASRSFVDGCLVLGRYAVRRSTSPPVVGAIAAGAMLPRLRQAAAWSVKKAVKRVTGESYLAIRRLLLDRGVEL